MLKKIKAQVKVEMLRVCLKLAAHVRVTGVLNVI